MQTLGKFPKLWNLATVQKAVHEQLSSEDIVDAFYVTLSEIEDIFCVFPYSYRNISGSLGEREIVVGAINSQQGECFHQMKVNVEEHFKGKFWGIGFSYLSFEIVKCFSYPGNIIWRLFCFLTDVPSNIIEFQTLRMFPSWNIILWG